VLVTAQFESEPKYGTGHQLQKHLRKLLPRLGKSLHDIGCGREALAQNAQPARSPATTGRMQELVTVIASSQGLSLE